MLRLDGLLLRRLHRHAGDAAAAVGLEDAGCIVAIGLVATHVRAHVAGRQQPHRVPLPHEAPRPVVRAAAGFHHDPQRRPLLERAGKRPPRQPFPFDHPTLAIGKCQLEYVFCKINRNGRSMHGGLLS